MFKKKYFKSIVQIIAIDSHVLATLLLRGWGLIAGFCTMLLVPHCLTRDEQGFYFTFTSLISIQFFFDLGLNHVLSLIVSHDAALLDGNIDVALRESVNAKLISIHFQARRWYRILAAVFGIIVFLAGFSFFADRSLSPTVDWFGPWLGLCVGSALNLYVSPQLAICEGFGQMGRVASLRLIQSLIGNAVMWVLLFTGYKLWAAVIIPTIGAVFSFWWVRKNNLTKLLGINIIKDDLINSSEKMLNWRRDVFPLQWRIGLSWVSGYFIFQLFNPVVFAAHGSEVAGRVGLALAACTAILGIGMSWVNATSVVMSSAIARGDRDMLRSTFQRVAVRSVLFTASTTFLLVIACFIGGSFGYGWANRIIDWQTLAFIGVANLVNCIISSMAIFMRCHKEEPMVVASVVMAFLTSISVFWFCRYGVKWVFLIYAALMLFVALPWTYILFRGYWLRVNVEC